MFEIEAKVPISKADHNRLKKEISTFAKKKGEGRKTDSYYGKEEGFFLRIREKKDIAILGMKLKNIQKGWEMNHEIDIPLKSKSKFATFLKKIGIDAYAKKTKISEVYLFGSMQIELNLIEGLGHYLEIEHIVKTEAEIPKAKKALLQLFEKLGFQENQFSNKYYLDLLEEKNKL